MITVPLGKSIDLVDEALKGFRQEKESNRYDMPRMQHAMEARQSAFALRCRCSTLGCIFEELGSCPQGKRKFLPEQVIIPRRQRRN